MHVWIDGCVNYPSPKRGSTKGISWPTPMMKNGSLTTVVTLSNCHEEKQKEKRVQVIQEIHLVAKRSQTSQAIKPKPPLNGWLVQENPVFYLSPREWTGPGGFRSVTFTKSFVNWCALKWRVRTKSVSWECYNGVGGQVVKLLCL